MLSHEISFCMSKQRSPLRTVSVLFPPGNTKAVCTLWFGGCSLHVQAKSEPQTQTALISGRNQFVFDLSPTVLSMYFSVYFSLVPVVMLRNSRLLMFECLNRMCSALAWSLSVKNMCLKKIRIRFSLSVL